ncbi:MAG: hypothetical protein ACYDCS_02985 [Candidatus Dormibacteria bacterium]
MASVLRRFRRLSPPGAAMSGIAPPADAEAARADELAPVLETLDAIQREADALLDAARAEAEEIHARAASGAQATIAGGAERAVSEKARASQQRLDRFTAARDHLLARARDRAAAVREEGDALAEAVAAAVVERLQSLALGGVAR